MTLLKAMLWSALLGLCLMIWTSNLPVPFLKIACVFVFAVTLPGLIYYAAMVYAGAVCAIARETAQKNIALTEESAKRMTQNMLSIFEDAEKKRKEAQ